MFHFRSIVRTFGVGLAACLTVAMFSGCKMSPEERAEKATSHVSRKLDLTDAQKAEFKKLADLAVADFKAMNVGRKALANEVEKQIVAEKADTALIKKMMNEQNTKRQEVMLKWVDQIAGFQAKLTPEQRQKALKMLQKFRDRFESQTEE